MEIAAKLRTGEVAISETNLLDERGNDFPVFIEVLDVYPVNPNLFAGIDSNYYPIAAMVKCHLHCPGLEDHWFEYLSFIHMDDEYVVAERKKGFFGVFHRDSITNEYFKDTAVD